MGQIISFFNHKGGVGKTTLVYNLAYALAKENKKILLIDADPQMNLTAYMYGLSNSVEYSTDEQSKWQQNTSKFISFYEHLNNNLKSVTLAEQCTKVKFTCSKCDKIDLISGSIKLSILESELYAIIRNRNSFTETIPYKFEQAIRIYKNDYDFILIDTSPSASSILNGLVVMSSDYFIAPVSPSFFSLQAIDNLSEIFRNWNDLLGSYKTTMGFQGISCKVKFLGIVVQLAKRFQTGAGNEKKFTNSSEDWLADLNRSVANFVMSSHSLSAQEFKTVFPDATPYIIEKCCDFTQKLRSVAERAGVPVINLTQDLCNEYAQYYDNGKKKPAVDITTPDGQYKKSFDSISNSYQQIALNLINNLNKIS